MAAGLSLVPGGGMAIGPGGSGDPFRVGLEQAAAIAGERWRLPAPERPTLSEIFAASPRDGGWAGFLLAAVEAGKPLLWIQERMAILEAGRVHPPGLRLPGLIHVEARDSKAVLWAMEEGLRCAGLGGVIGEIWGDPAALDFTASRRLAVAAERHGVAGWLVRLGGTANLSGARMRWRIASAASPAHPLNPRAPGRPAWDAELFRARGLAPGRWRVGHDGGAADPVDLAPGAGDRALGEGERRSA